MWPDSVIVPPPDAGIGAGLYMGATSGAWALRRSTCTPLPPIFAKPTHKGRAPLDQIQLSLGASSIPTTEIDLGVDQKGERGSCNVLDVSRRTV